MSIEETLAQQFQEFRQWQMQQEEILLAKQKDHIDFLSDEQNRVYQALSLSIDEISLTDQSLKEDANLIDLDTPDNECTSPKLKNSSDLLGNVAIENNNNKSFELEVPNMMLNLKNTATDSKPNLDLSYNQLESLSDLSKTDLQSFFSDHSFKSNIPLDDMPVPSPKKDFETLLEEKLRDSGEIVINNNSKPAVKKPFLKKGEGLARFKPSPARSNQNFPKCTLKSRLSLPANAQSNSKPCQTSNSDKSSSKTKTNDIKRKSLPNIPPVAQKKLTLKNVPVPKKKNCVKPVETRSNKLCVKGKKTSELMSDPSSSDLESKNKREQEEVRIFELLEDKAENSSFCSTSSTVIAFLQQSTPLKHKALLHSASKHRISIDNVGDQTLEEIIESTKSNRLPLPQLPEIEIEDQKSFEWESLPNSKTSNQVILPYGTDVEVDYENYNPNIGASIEENQASLHVRFAEHNEYKNITDNSSVSSDSQTIMNHADDKGAWSDCSATDSSDAESTLLYKLQNACQTNFESFDFLRKNAASHDEDITEIYDHDEEENDSVSESGLKNDTLCADSTEDEKYNTMTLLKSELLKTRLIELEREIEIFRKENASLTFQRQKLQEERTKLQEERISLQRSFKEQKEALEIEKKNMESILQEERKRINREKAALENRLKDAYGKSQKSKHERQETQALRDQLDELREEYRHKENKWTASSARQRSQMRVLQTENARLKQELEKHQEQKNARFKKKTNSSNTKAIHQINKALASRKKTSPFKNEEILFEDEDRVPDLDDFIRELDLEVLKDDDSNQKIEKQKMAKTAESIARTRDLYESLLREAVDDFSNVQLEKKKSQAESQENGSESSNDNGTSNDQDSDHNKTITLDSSHKELKKSDEKSNKVDQKINNSKREIREVHHPDGHIEYWYPNGNVKKVFPDMNLSKIIYYNGDVRINKDDGTVKYFYASSRTWHTTMPDGSEILEYTDGQIEKKSSDGTTEVIFVDGSVKVVHPDGSEKWTLSDGTIAETTTDGDKILIFPNGQREIHTKESKRREYPDGTVKFVYPDGVQETRYANGRVRLKDKLGNLIMDSYQ